MKAAPKVSILLPVRDAGAHLATCVRSVERQSLRDFEVVAVDDGSRDGSGPLLDAWAARDPRVRVVRTPPRGLVSALNTGLESCRGQLVARLDADDAMAVRRLELQVERLERGPEDVISCLVTHFPRERIAEGNRLYEDWLNRLTRHEDIVRERFVESPLAHPTAMARRELLLAVGGYRDLGWPEDYDLWLRLAARGSRFAKVEKRLYFWREHAGRATRTDERYRVARFLACKAHHLARGPLRGVETVVVWGAGPTGRKLVSHLEREGVEVVAFLDIDPKKIGRIARGRPILAPEALGELRARPGRTLVLAAVAARGARELIRGRLHAAGLVEGSDYWCVA